jgi:hypothetical protein
VVCVLQHLHEAPRNVVYRDLKPENCILDMQVSAAAVRQQCGSRPEGTARGARAGLTALWRLYNGSLTTLWRLVVARGAAVVDIHTRQTSCETGQTTASILIGCVCWLHPLTAYPRRWLVVGSCCLVVGGGWWLVVVVGWWLVAVGCWLYHHGPRRATSS